MIHSSWNSGLDSE